MSLAREETGSELLVAATRVRDERRARQNAQRKRLLAAERAARLESQLRDAAETGMRAEIARSLAARRRLLAVQKVAAKTQATARAELGSTDSPAACSAQPIARKAFARYSGAAAMGLLVGAVVTALTPYAADLSRFQERAAQFTVLPGAPGDGLKLVFSSSISVPAAR